MTRLSGDLLPRIEEARSLAIALFGQIAGFLAGRPQNETDTRLRLTQTIRNSPGWSEIEIAWDELSLPLSIIQQGLMNIFEQLYRLPDDTMQDQDDTLLALTRALRISTDLRVGAAAALAEPDPDMVYWTEIEGHAAGSSNSTPTARRRSPACRRTTHPARSASRRRRCMSARRCKPTSSGRAARRS